MTPFLFAIHSHQPVGNFDHVFEDAVMGSYEPFLQMLSDFPDIKVALHYSGCLLEWIEKNRVNHLDVLKRLVDRGQIELLGGAYYEPIFTAVPDRDLRAQISSYLDHLEDTFGRRPRGIWITERVWDPALPAVLHDLGVDFTLLDDSHFRFAGIKMEDAWGPYSTEREGKPVTIFPIDQKLRYIIPFKEPEETVNYIRQRAKADPGFVACYGDDGEKFGVWPDTREWVFEKGWLARFFNALTEAKDDIEFVHFSDYLDKNPPRGRAYIPPASYQEMMEWTLPPELGEKLEDFVHEIKEEDRWQALSPFIRGGHWDMFLSKYDESNRMQKRMLLASERLYQQGAHDAARQELMRGQCNCAYWHGVFGGLYLNFLRHAVYEKIISAENMAGPVKTVETHLADYDGDGSEEVIVRVPGLNAIITPAMGGAVCGLEYTPANFSLSNVMSRRRETYHRRLTGTAQEGGGDSPDTIHQITRAKEEGLEKLLVYDRFPRYSVQEHLVPQSLALDEIMSESTIELGAFAGAPWELVEAGDGRVVLRREDQCSEVPVEIEKTYLFKEDEAGFDVAYCVRVRGDRPISVALAVEFNLTLLADDLDTRYYMIDNEKPEDPLMNGMGEHKLTDRVELVCQDQGWRTIITSNQHFDLYRYPIECVSQSESGFEKTYQGSCMWAAWPLTIEGGEEAELSLSFTVEKTG